MDLFHEIAEGVAVLRTRGVYRQSKIYRRGDDVFAAQGSGYVRLLSHGGTTVPNTTWLDVEGPGVSASPGRGPKWTG